MSTILEEPIELQPWPDLEDFMAFSQESRIDGACMKELVKYWNKWKELLKSFQITDGKKSWLAVWLPKEVETEVDDSWTNSPSQAWLLNALAQFLCMSAIREKIPPIADGGCAPAPDPTLTLKNALVEAGLDVDQDSGILQRKYAIVTWYPFKGGCEVCSLRENCPKGSGKSEFTNFLLDGYERGKQD